MFLSLISPSDTDLSRAFNDATHADVRIHLFDTVVLPAHSIILVAQSEYFRRVFNGDTKEAISKEFEFNKGSLQAHWRVFQYIYSGKYSEEPYLEFTQSGMNSADLAHLTTITESVLLDDDELSKDVRVYQLADYFQVTGLHEYALQKFISKIEKLWVSELFVDCIRDVYTSTSDPKCSIRVAILNITCQHINDLRGKLPFQDLMREGGDFAVDIVLKLSNDES